MKTDQVERLCRFLDVSDMDILNGAWQWKYHYPVAPIEAVNAYMSDGVVPRVVEEYVRHLYAKMLIHGGKNLPQEVKR